MSAALVPLARDDLAALAADLIGDAPPSDPASVAGDEYDRGAIDGAAFLEDLTLGWQPDWWLNLCAIWPDRARGGLVGRSWRVDDLPSSWPAIRKQAAAWNREGRGVYFCADPLRHRVESKPAAPDVAAVAVLHADIDPDTSAGYAAGRAALWRTLGASEVGCAPIAWLIDSGNGAGVFARLSEPMPPDHGVAARRAWQARLAAGLTGGVVDPTADAARLMRLPGTLNRPSPAKLAKGYPAEGAWATLRTHSRGACAPRGLAEALAAEGPHRASTGSAVAVQEDLRAPSADRLAAIMRDLPNPDDLDRRGWVAVLHMVRAAGRGVCDDEGEDLAREWSARWNGVHDDAEFDRTWQSIGRSRVGWGDLVAFADSHGTAPGRREAQRRAYSAAILDFAPYVAEAVLRAPDRPPAPETSFGRLRPKMVSDALAAPPRQHLLKPLLGRGEFSEFWGAPKAGKSFLALRLLYGLALGLGAWDLKAKRVCRVLYIAAEGEGGFAGRLAALRDQLGDPEDAFQYLAQPVQIGPPSADLGSVIALAKAMRADIVALDTLARTFGAGDENTAQDMGQYVAAVDRIRAETGAHVLVIHHGRKDGGDARGSGALGGAVDLIVKVEKGRDGAPSTATVEAAKDDSDGRAYGFRLDSVDLGQDEDGDPRRTCIAVPLHAPVAKTKELSGGHEAALRVLRDLVAAEGTAPPWPDAGGVRAVPDARWRAECETQRVSSAADKPGRDRAMRRAIETARSAGRIAVRDGWVWLGQGRAP